MIYLLVCLGVAFGNMAYAGFVGRPGIEPIIHDTFLQWAAIFCIWLCKGDWRVKHDR